MDEKLVKSFLTFLREQENQLTRNNSPDYNVFRVINKAMLLEDQTNCALLIDWLDPKGHHGEGNLFLRTFLQLLGVSDEHLDHHAWEILDHPNFECGYPDIVIQNREKRFLFFVELKIKAEDHPGQLDKYYEYLTANVGIVPERKKLTYLTLDGRPPSNLSNFLSASGYFQRLSLQGDIQKWLRSVLPEIKNEHVKNTVTNYLGILPEIVDEALGRKMESEVIRLLSLPHLKPLATLVYQNYGKISGTIKATASPTGFRPDLDRASFLAKLKNDGFVTEEKGSNGKVYPIQFFADIKGENVRIGLKWTDAPSDRILELPDFDELKYWLINSAYYIPDPSAGLEIAWRNMGPLSQQSQSAARLHDYFWRFAGDFGELVTRINKSICLQRPQTTDPISSAGEFDCSV